MTAGRWMMVLALGILVTSQVTDWLEPTFGLSVTTLPVGGLLATGNHRRRP